MNGNHSDSFRPTGHEKLTPGNAVKVGWFYKNFNLRKLTSSQHIGHTCFSSNLMVRHTQQQ